MTANKPKKWGIRVRDSGWMQDSNAGNNYQSEDATYSKRGDAVQDAKDFNSMRKDNIYTVKEYK